ncbi:MAG: ComF family protein [Treponema sp.]|nr:ComF family protein [Treponema sp.]
MKMFQMVSHFLSSCLSLMTGGQTCLCCGNLSLWSPLCPECQQEKLFTWTEKSQRCICCGKELVSEIEVCTLCRNQSLLTHTQQVLPIHSYRLWKKDLLFSWKTAGMRQLSPVLAQLMADFLKKELGDLGNISLVPVPPRKGKIRQQGWDQVQELCQYLKHYHGFQVLPLLERQSVEQQKKLDRQGRLDKLGKSYSLAKKFTKELAKKEILLPKKVILIDDILTTGVTLETCARALREAGVEEVYGCTLFYVT